MQNNEITITLPCAIGDKFYVINDKNEIEEKEVFEIEVMIMENFTTYFFATNDLREPKYSSRSNNVFLDKAQAHEQKNKNANIFH